MIKRFKTVIRLAYLSFWNGQPYAILNGWGAFEAPTFGPGRN